MSVLGCGRPGRLGVRLVLLAKGQFKSRGLKCVTGTRQNDCPVANRWAIEARWAYPGFVDGLILGQTTTA